MKTKLTEQEKSKLIMLARYYDAEYLARHFNIDIEFIKKFLEKHKREINLNKERRKNLSKETACEIYKILNDDKNTLTHSQISKKYNASLEIITAIKEKKSYKKFIQQVDLEIILEHLDIGLKDSNDEEFKKARKLFVEFMKEYYE